MNWKEDQKSKNNFGDLIENKVPFLRIKNFISNEEATLLLNQLNSIGFDYYKNVSPKIGKIGVTVFENQKSPLEYFNSGSKIAKKIKISAPIHNKLMGRVIHLFGLYGFNILSREDDYFAGLVRIMKGGTLLHIDYAPFDAQSYDISQIETQIACNVFLKTPDHGGELVVYNRQWELEDEKLKEKCSYGYSKKVVENVEFDKIKPEVGDLILFNSRNYHKVLPNENLEDNRITVSCFAAIKSGIECQLWS